MARNLSMEFFGGLNFGPVTFLVLFEAQGLFGFWFLPPFKHPCQLKSRISPLGMSGDSWLRVSRRADRQIGQWCWTVCWPIVGLHLVNRLVDFTSGGIFFVYSNFCCYVVHAAIFKGYWQLWPVYCESIMLLQVSVTIFCSNILLYAKKGHNWLHSVLYQMKI